MTSCSQPVSPPVAQEKPHRMEKFGDLRQDPYFWLKERENPEVISYLKAENAYVDAKLAPVKGLREKLFEELKSRVKENDTSYPYKSGNYFYFTKYEKGKEYPIFMRRKGTIDGPEEILIDANEIAKGHSYCSVHPPVPTEDHTKIVYAVDTVGRRFYDLYIKDMASGKVEGPISATAGAAAWMNNGLEFYYLKQHPDTLRSQWLYRHKLGSAKDELIYEEKDETFSLDLHKTTSAKYLFVSSQSTLSTEVRFLSADRPEDKFAVFLKREKDHEYSLDDGGDGFYILSNWKAKNFRVLKASYQAKTKEQWKEVVAHNKDVYLDNIQVFSKKLTLLERRNGLREIRVIDRASNASDSVRFPDPAYVVDFGHNEIYDTDFLRFDYESPNRPATVYDYVFSTKENVFRKQKEIPNLDVSQYASERVWATARDGVKVPVTLVYKKAFQRDGTAPLLQYAYGSYGISMEPWFSSSVFSLLDRGFVYAVAHIRGGSEMGRYWYEDGKLLKKKNTFTDFLDVTEFLVKEKYADPKRVYAQGASAGGLLMGAVANMGGQLYHGIQAGVPFVDVMTTMLDDTIPLTTGEYDEWGNPNKKEYYEYMRTYSPYDNVEKKAYPNILVTTGLHDSQVQYWEPAKWVARLRKLKTDQNLLLMHTEMEAGHSGTTGRFESLKETALEYAFFLMLAEKK